MSPGASSPGLRAIDRLKAAANLKPLKKVVVLNNGDEFELYHRPLTMAQRARAQKNAKSDDAAEFALQLLTDVAMDEYGQKLFSPGDIAEMRNLVRDEDVQKLMLAVLSGGDEEDEAESIDMKSGKAGAS
jgi:hypothetical protein